MTNVIQDAPCGEDSFQGVLPPRTESRVRVKGNTELAGEKSAIPTLSVVDDDEEIHLFLKDLGDLGYFKMVGAFYKGASALDRLPKELPDAVVMDIRLPDMSGIDCAAKLKTILPELSIVMLTGYPDSRTFFRSLLAGAKGFLVKPVSAKEFLNSIDDILSGDFALSNQVVPFLIELVHHVRQLTQESRLSAREAEILACLFNGFQDKEIASALGIGIATVHTHMHRLFEKLGVHSRREIIDKYLNMN